MNRPLRLKDIPPKQPKVKAAPKVREKKPPAPTKAAIDELFPPSPVPTPTDLPREASEAAQQAVEDAYRLPYEPPMFDMEVAARSPEQELAARELARRRLLPFIQRFRPKYKAGWVHSDICRRLERFVCQVERGEEPRLLLMMPPRSGKSEIGSRHLGAWVLGQHPDWEIIAASHTSSLSMTFSRYLRDLMRNPAYSAVFPDAVLDASSQSTENWNLTRGGGYLAAGVGSGITGRGAHILLLDDLVKDMEAADSTTIRDNTWEWYLSTAYTRLAPGGGVIGIMTWWHDSDWAGRIQQAMESSDGDQFEIVKYPAINEVGDEYILPDDSIVQIGPSTPVPEGALRTRVHNTGIHPERYSTEALLRIKRNLIAGGQKRVWDALFQQNPVPDEGNYFGADMFRYYGTAPSRQDMFVYQAWDFAISEGKDSDYTVGMCVGQDHRANLYVLDVRRFKSGDSFVITETILDFAEHWQADLLGVEDGQIWKALEAPFLRACEDRRYYPAYETLKPLTDKMVRATPLRGHMQQGKVFFDKHTGFFSELQRELLHFPAGKNDDQVDALSWTVRLTLSRAAPRREIVTVRDPEDSWKKRLTTILGETTGSHMSA